MSDYQEYNEAMLEVALPSDREIELTMDYGGFPRETGMCPSCRAARRSALNTYAWKMPDCLPA
ncbi:MAG: hypothetical protein ACLTYN_12455 [Dysosmobacter welbionis]